MNGDPRIALLVGGDDQTGQIWSNRLGLNMTGSTDVYRLAGLSDANGMHITKGYFRQNRRHAFQNYDLLINLITDADQHSGVLEVLEKALRGSGVPLLNKPSMVRLTTREGVAKRLLGINHLIVPRVRKFRKLSLPILRELQASGTMSFPVILRRPGTHSGRTMDLLLNPQDAPTSDSAVSGCYLTEFVDFRSLDNLYRKYRVFVFGGIIVFRHMIISDSWNVHMADRERYMMSRPQLLAESQGLYQSGVESLDPKVRTVLRHINERLGLDFFGVDFGIMPNGDVVLFEANATMNFFPVSTDPRLAAMQLCVPPAREAFHQMITNALQKQTSKSA